MLHYDEESNELMLRNNLYLPPWGYSAVP